MFQIFFTILKIRFSKKEFQGYNRKAASLITPKILECNVESCYKNTFEIRNILLIFFFIWKKISHVLKND